MNVGVVREANPLDRRVALTPPVVRQLTALGHTVWVERGAGDGAMFRDEEYTRAGATIVYSPAEVIHRSNLVAQISAPTAAELELAVPGTAMMAFYHMAVAASAVVEALLSRRITAIGCEVIRAADGGLPVLAAASEIAGRMTIPLAAHLLRTTSGGRGILLGGSPGVAPAHVVILGAGVVGSWAARAATAAGARVTVMDIDGEKLRRLLERTPHVAVYLADPESIAAACKSADVLIGAVLVAGAKTPHVVTRKMVESMRPGSAVIDVAIDQGGCIETSRLTSIGEPTFQHHGVVHYCVPNLTAELGHSTSISLAWAALPYLLALASEGVEGALRSQPGLAAGVYTHSGACVHPLLASAFGKSYRPLADVLGGNA